MFAAIGRDHAVLAISAPGIASKIEKGNIPIRLVDASGWALPRDSQRLAGHNRVILVRPHVELLNFVPVLRLVQWTIQIAEPRGRVELKIFRLIGLPATVGTLRWTASAPTPRHVVPNPVRIGPVARQVRMPGQPRRGRRLVYWRFRLGENATGELPRDLDCRAHACRHWRHHIHVARLRLRCCQVADDRAVPTLDHLAGVEHLDLVQRVVPVLIVAVGELRGRRSQGDEHALGHVLRIKGGCRGRPLNTRNRERHDRLTRRP